MSVLSANSKRKSAKVFGALIATCMMSQPVVALSCMKPNLARSFNYYAQAEETYVIAKGSVKFLERVPKYEQSTPRSVKAEFSGALLGRSGLGKEQTFPITLTTTCASVWCGGLPRVDQPLIAFLQKTDTGYQMVNDACPGVFHSAVQEDQISLLQRCLKRGECNQREIESLDTRR